MQSGWEEAEEPTKKTEWSRSYAAGTFGENYTSLSC